MTTGVPWRTAMHRALYGTGGFYTTQQPGEHFHTSSRSPVFAEAIAELARRVDTALDHPDPFTIVDVGAGWGELAGAIHGVLADESLGRRLHLIAVDRRRRPPDLPDAVRWRRTPPRSITGLLLACELLDNVACEVVEVDPDGVPRYLVYDPVARRTGLGGQVYGADAQWLARWWPVRTPGERAEIGRTRDRCWARLHSRLTAGAALAVDYGHTRRDRPAFGTLSGFASGREVPPVPDGGCDITVHVAMDSLGDGLLCAQRQALAALGVSGARPPLDLADRDPHGYLRALSRAAEATGLADAAGLGGHYWLLRGVGVRPSRLLPDLD